MKKTTLLIMVEGIGSRFSGRIKQLEPVGGHGGNNHGLSIHDAGEAGFRKIIDVAKIATPAPSARDLSTTFTH